MRRIVVDAATVLAWFDEAGPGRQMRLEYEAGAFLALSPRRLFVDLLAAAAARGVSGGGLEQLGTELPRLGIQLQDPPLPLVAGWLGRGLEAEVAPYAALAEWLEVPLAARDDRLIRGAASVIGS